MIAWLRGLIRSKRPPFLLLDVGGTGYELQAPMTTFYQLPKDGGETDLFCHQIVRDDGHSLYGFAAERERDLFRQLIRVNGVGPKLALAILSGMSGDGFARCVFEGDAAGLARLPGIGKKTAERLIIEMRDRLAPTDGSAPPSGVATSAAPYGMDPAAEAVSALVALGFKPPEASRRVQAVAAEGMTCEEIVRLALKALAGGASQ